MTNTLFSSHSRLILASSSAYRQQQLQQLQLNFECIPPSIDESPLPDEDAAALASRLAMNKGLAIASQIEGDATIIASDQTASCGTAILGKPGSEQRAIDQLQACSGRVVTFNTSLWVGNEGGKGLSDTVTTQVTFRSLNEAEIKTYIKREQALDCAGSFKCEGLGISLFESIRSDDPSALIGLPLIRLTSFLKHFGIHVI